MIHWRLSTILAVFLVGSWGIVVIEAAPDLDHGKTVYADKCARCHGAIGKGDGRVAERLDKKPWDFTDRKKMSEFTDAEMKKAVLDGKQSMPGYRGKISDKDLDDAIAYIRTFAGQ